MFHGFCWQDINGYMQIVRQKVSGGAKNQGISYQLVFLFYFIKLLTQDNTKGSQKMTWASLVGL